MEVSHAKGSAPKEHPFVGASSASKHSQDWGIPVSGWGAVGSVGQLEEENQDLGHQTISKPAHASVSSFIY